MIEFQRLGLANAVSANAIELVNERLPCCKKFALGENQFNIQVSLSQFHYTDDGINYSDIDLTPQQNDNSWTLSTAPYAATISQHIPSATYVEKITGIQLTIALAAINGIALVTPSVVSSNITMTAPHARGHSIIYPNIFVGGDLAFVLTAEGIHTELTIRSGTPSLLWTISQNISDPIATENLGSGRDAKGNTPEHVIARSALTQNGKLWTGTFQETFTGNVLGIIDKKTRQIGVIGQITYPAVVIS